MVFLGGAVLANLVRIDLFLESISPKAKQYTYISPDCRQGRYVGIQTGVAGTGRACSGKAWSAVNRMYLGGCFVVSFLFFFFVLYCFVLSRITCKPCCPASSMTRSVDILPILFRIL